MSAEDVPVRAASLFDGVLQRAGHVLLPDDLGELLRTVFAGQDGITHGRKSRLYVTDRPRCSGRYKTLRARECTETGAANYFVAGSSSSSFCDSATFSRYPLGLRTTYCRSAY